MDTPEVRTSLIRTLCMVPATMYIELYKITPEMRTPQDFNQDACTCIVYRNRMRSYCFNTIEFEAKVIF